MVNGVEQMAAGMSQPPVCVFLDRDGTLIVDKHYLADPAGVELIEGVPQALGRLRQRGVELYLLTNQSGIGRGLYSLADVDACNRRMLELLGLGRDLFAGICIAPEATAVADGYRKPSPRYINEVVEQRGFEPAACVMVGDRRSDWEAGIAAGIQAVAVRSGKEWATQDQSLLTAKQIPVFATLAAWVAAIDQPPHAS